jgi:hypothetical protein
MRTYSLALLGLAGLIVSDVARAQAPSQPVPPSPPGKYPPPEVIAPAQGTTGKAATDKVEGGVIQPPNVDSGMSVKPPVTAPQSMTVVPAPGTPGGNPNVTPK